MEIRANILREIEKAQANKCNSQKVYDGGSSSKKNEFLFFIKPEITLSDPNIDLGKIIDLIFSRLEEFGLEIVNVRVLCAEYLEKHDIIAQHYGVINKLSTGGVTSLSQNAINVFQEKFGKPIEECTVLGGHQFLEKYPMFNADSLEFLWQNKENIKLSGGTYVVQLSLDGKEVFLIDGFHPKQLEHFTASGRSIVVFTLSGDLAWEDARTKFVGATNPQKAVPGSLRRTFLDRKIEFGLQDVSQGSNGVHLSAGPVEGLIELIRYNSNFELESGELPVDDFIFGKLLLSEFGAGLTEKVLSNNDVSYQGNEVSIFDLTEEMDSDAAIDLLKVVLKK